jgi:hypothetical protein
MSYWDITGVAAGGKRQGKKVAFIPMNLRIEVLGLLIDPHRLEKLGTSYYDLKSLQLLN